MENRNVTKLAKKQPIKEDPLPCIRSVKLSARVVAPSSLFESFILEYQIAVTSCQDSRREGLYDFRLTPHSWHLN